MAKTVSSQQQTQGPDGRLIAPVPRFTKLWNEAVHNQIFWYVSVIAMFFVGLAVANQVIHPTTGTTHAGTNTAKVSIQPTAQSMPPDTTFQLWVTADNPAAAVAVKVTFDPALIQLTGEISTTPSPLTRIVQKTAMADANSTGVIYLTLGLDPASRTTPPTGTFELATFPFAVKTTSQNVTTAIHVDPASVQVVNPDGSIFTVTTADSTVTLNPVATPTPTPTPVATSTPTPTPPPLTDNIAPSVTITSPADGSKVNETQHVSIKATAADNVGVAKVEFSVGTKLLCTVAAAPYTCTWVPGGTDGTKYTLTAKAYDAAGNTASASVTVTTH